jgi:hypothetical protein
MYPKKQEQTGPTAPEFIRLTHADMLSIKAAMDNVGVFPDEESTYKKVNQIIEQMEVVYAACKAEKAARKRKKQLTRSTVAA